jgi:hypothetical protein
VRKVWDGRADLVELQADARLDLSKSCAYACTTLKRTSGVLNYANSAGGRLSPPVIGEFKNGWGEFYGQDQLNGRAIYVGNVFSDITSSSCYFGQAFSEDGSARHGK